MNRRRAAGTHQNGFTLLEILVVLAIVGIASVVVIRVTAKPPPALSAQSAAMMLASELVAARADAMRDNSPNFVVIDLRTQRYWSKGRPRKHVLPAGVRIRAEGQNLVLRNAQQIEIHFRADGSTNGGRLLLDASGRQASISVDWLTGATRVDKTF